MEHLDDPPRGAVHQRLAAADQDHGEDLGVREFVGEAQDAVLADLPVVQDLGGDALRTGQVADGGRVEVDHERGGQAPSSRDVEDGGEDGSLIELADEVEVALDELGADGVTQLRTWLVHAGLISCSESQLGALPFEGRMGPVGRWKRFRETSPRRGAESTEIGRRRRGGAVVLSICQVLELA
ncbi:hypothetical protein [Kitasatospora sp. NPDC093558]|uniref:hypothetical protein n=1 Tax=Kitasatospora sp. NPDC093558 TaxID=3155201 RepID=UPI003441B2F9